GAAPLGVVYATDARAAPRVDVVAQFPRGSHDPIRYPAALVGDAPTPAARALLMALTAPAAQAIFAAHGFTAPPDAG
ncbi:MAG: substrate-binding domain-containing protein, partial [Paracoccaceae bacterium]